jgi:hypothetical protein
MGNAMIRLMSSAAIVAALVLPSEAMAAPTAPSGQVIRGVISQINGRYGLTVEDGEGFFDSVTLHQGTTINPTGLALRPGMRIAIEGRADGNTFEANRIVTQLVEGENTLVPAARSTTTLIPQEIPNGTFQTAGPSAVGGG